MQHSQFWHAQVWNFVEDVSITNILIVDSHTSSDPVLTSPHHLLKQPLLPLQGQVLIKGKARRGLLADDKELASQLKVGMVFQNGALFDSLNVQENVGFMLYEHSNLPDDRIEVWSAT